MGAGMFGSATARCEHVVRQVKLTFESTTSSKSRARALVRMLKLAIKPKHAAILYDQGAALICIQVLQDSQKGSPMRELALLTLLCLSLDIFVKRDLVATNGAKVIPTVTKVLRQERPATSIKYAALAVIHSLSRDDRNLPAIYNDAELVEGLIEAIAYESEGSPLRKLACEVIASLSEVRDYQMVMYRAFSEVAGRLLIGEISTGSPVLDIALEILANLSAHEGNQEALLKERVVIECAVKTMESQSQLIDRTRAKFAVITMFYNIAGGSEGLALRVAIIPRIIQACVDCVDAKTPVTDACGVAALKLLHLLTIYRDSRLAVFPARGLADTLFLQSRSNVYARMAFINITGAFDDDDEADPERRALVGCEEMDDRIMDLLQAWCTSTSGKRSLSFADEVGEGNEEEDQNETDEEAEERRIADLARKATLLSLSVLLRRRYHLERMRSRVSPLVLKALDRAISSNDVRTVTFALSCLRLLMRGLAPFEMDNVLELLGRVQEKVHPIWKPVRLDAERLISRLSTSGTTEMRLKPVVDMLEKVLDDRQKGYTRSLDVPLQSLVYSLDFASTEEKRATGRTLTRLLPRALDKAMHEDDALSARYAFDLYEKVASNQHTDDKEWEAEKSEMAVAVREIMAHYKSQVG